MSRTAIILFNLGGPDSLDAVHPFLRNLFGDPAILSVPGPVRAVLSRLIAWRRARVARHIYAQIGGRSPILEQTEAQADALQSALGPDFRTFVCMRYWHPRAGEVVRAVEDWSPDRIVLLPLYPQFSATTTGSSFAEWRREARKIGLSAAEHAVCCWPTLSGFVEAVAELTRPLLEENRRVLFSAHGLPKRVVAAGDPYQAQVEQSAVAVARALGLADWSLGYQSRVGPLEWIGPSTESEIRRAAADGVGLVVVPIAFVSEHSETLVELDIEYAALAASLGLSYRRAPTVGISAAFVAGLAGLVTETLAGGRPCHPAAGQPLCGRDHSRCPCLNLPA